MRRYTFLCLVAVLCMAALPAAMAADCLNVAAPPVTDEVALAMQRVLDILNHPLPAAFTIAPLRNQEATLVGDDQGTMVYRSAPASTYEIRLAATPLIVLFGTCDTTEECHERASQLCQEEGHGKAKYASVKVTTHSDGSRMCSADCEEDGAVAFVICEPAA